MVICFSSAFGVKILESGALLLDDDFGENGLLASVIPAPPIRYVENTSVFTLFPVLAVLIPRSRQRHTFLRTPAVPPMGAARMLRSIRSERHRHTCRSEV